jgi:hypothetical protein
MLASNRVKCRPERFQMQAATINHWINTIAKPLPRDSSGAWMKSETTDE